MLGARADARRGVMFGYPAYYTRGRLFACVLDDQIVLKLPEATVTALAGTRGIGPFTRNGRTMRQWVTLTRPRALALARSPALVLQSLAFVRASGKSKSTGRK